MLEQDTAALLIKMEAQLEKIDREMNNDGLQEQPMFAWTLEQLCESTDGDLVGPLTEASNLRFDSVSTDTRTLKPGALYIAIKGEHFDGHAFIEEAVKQGAVAVLVSQDVETVVPGVLVEDTRIALGQFACWHRKQMPLKKLIAVTGSNGKTSVKTLLNSIFSSVGNTLATEGNLNNDFGVPRTLLNLRPEHEYAVIEMGANHPKEIAYLTALALPDIAIINNAAGAHLEGFGSLQGVINTKGEIFQGLNKINAEKDGVAIVNTDSAGYEDWLKMLADLAVNKMIKFGSSDEADVRLMNYQTSTNSEEGIAFTLEIAGQCHKVSMPILGYHNAMNAAACTAVSLAAGLQWQQIKPGLESFAGVAGRLQKNKINSGWLIDDSYNANPESVKAGIDALVSLPGDSLLCLGAMAEVGETSDQAHAEVAEYAREQGVKHLLVYGEAAQHMPQTFGEHAYYFSSHQALVDSAAEILKDAEQRQQKMNVLTKGSRSAKMELVAKPLIETFGNS